MLPRARDFSKVLARSQGSGRISDRDLPSLVSFVNRLSAVNDETGDRERFTADPLRRLKFANPYSTQFTLKREPTPLNITTIVDTYRIASCIL